MGSYKGEASEGGKQVNKYKVNIGKLEPNDFKAGTIFFNINKKAQPGTYVYNIQAYKYPIAGESGGLSIGSDKKYDSIKKIYVEVS